MAFTSLSLVLISTFTFVLGTFPGNYMEMEFCILSHWALDIWAPSLSINLSKCNARNWRLLYIVISEFSLGILFSPLLWWKKWLKKKMKRITSVILGLLGMKFTTADFGANFFNAKWEISCAHFYKVPAFGIRNPDDGYPWRHGCGRLQK